MHWKRVTCELHDSYFCSMMIKTCHSKDGGSGYSFGHLWEEIEWTSNYYITQCTGNSISLGIRRELEKLCCRENSTQQRAGPPGLRLSNPGEWERNADGHKSGGQYVAVLFGLQLPLTHTPFNKVRYIFLRTVLLIFESLWFFMHMRIQQLHMKFWHNESVFQKHWASF